MLTISKPPFLLKVVNSREELAELLVNEVFVEIQRSDTTGQKLVLLLPTGSTPKLFYQNLAERLNHTQQRLDHIHFFAIDEYLGLEPKDQDSFTYYLFHNFFNRLQKKPNNGSYQFTFFKNCKNLKSAEQTAKRYNSQLNEVLSDQLCRSVFIGGIGQNPSHIGFNELIDEFDEQLSEEQKLMQAINTKTRVVKLHPNTVSINSKDFKGAIRPNMAITVGISEILRCDRIIIAASGKKKADSIYQTLTATPTVKHPSSILQLFNNGMVDIVVTQDACHQRLKNLPKTYPSEPIKELL